MGVMGKSLRGFASMPLSERRRIASLGGKAAFAKGSGHRWTRDEARAAGRRGGQISRGGKGALAAGADDSVPLPMLDLIEALDMKIVDLGSRLQKNREALMIIQQLPITRPISVKALGDALTSLFKAERSLIRMQRHLDEQRPKK